MSRPAAVRIVGGQPALVAVLAAEAEARGVPWASAPGPVLPDGPADAPVVDLGLPPADWPAGPELVEREADRARAISGSVPEGVRLVRVSVLGAAPDAPSLWQRAQAAAEEVVRARGASGVVLRVGVLLGEGVGPVACLRRVAERSYVVPIAAIGDAKLEPLAAIDLARYALAAAEAPPSALDDRYDLGCGEVLTGGLLVRGLVDNLGLRRLVLPLPLVPPRHLAPLYASDEFPAPAVARSLEAIARGLLPRRINAWEHFDVAPVELRLALAQATGMLLPLRSGGEGRFATWRKPEKRGILWTKPKR